jgi:hypothetical protein
MLVRFALGAATSVVAAIVSKAAGARLGGAFLAFPAILPASLTFVETKEGEKKADKDAIGAVLGGLALIAFAGVGESLFTRVNALAVLAAALGAWLAGAGVFYALAALLRPDITDS